MKKPKTIRHVSEKVEEWAPFFILWKIDGHYSADLHPDLARIQRTLRLGRQWQTEKAQARNAAADSLAKALEMVAVAYRTPAFKDEFGPFVIQALADALGEQVACVYFGRDFTAKNAADECTAIFKHAVKGILRNRDLDDEGEIDAAVALNAKFLPDTDVGKRAQAMLDKSRKALVAIAEARFLCEEHRRLPKLKEIKARMELIGLSYSAASKGADKYWRDVFTAAGLQDLPE